MADLLLKPPIPPRGQPMRWGQLYGSALAMACASAARAHSGPLVVVGESAREAARLHSEISAFAGAGLPVLAFPDWETLPFDVFSPHQDIVSARLETLASLGNFSHGVLVTAAESMMTRLPPVKYVSGGSLMLEVGQQLDRDALRVRLEAAGYTHVSQVLEHGDYATRGSLIDIFPMGSRVPYRIDLFDDEIDAIRDFDPDTQISDNRLSSIRVLPAREFPFDEAGISAFRQRYRRRFEGDPTRSQVYTDVSSGVSPGGIEYYLPLFFDTTASLFDYLPKSAAIVSTIDLADAARDAWTEISERYEQRRHDTTRPLLTVEELYLPPEDMETAWHRFHPVLAGSFKTGPQDDADSFDFETRAPVDLRLDPRAEQPASRLVEFAGSFDGRILFVAESAGHREQLLTLLRDNGLNVPVFDDWPAFHAASQRAGVIVAPLEQGLTLPSAGLAVVVEEQIFGPRARARRRRRQDRDPAQIIRDLTDLNPGAPVVHEEYGVGRYLGLNVLTVGDLTSEFVTLEYADGDKLYLPVNSLDRITRYTGSAPEHAPLHRLGTDQWAKARKRAAARIRDAAAELLDIYARRAARVGHSFAIDAAEYAAFRAEFPFDETEDQQAAIDNVVEDMRRGQPMDRVVCGDVGFGKTEVALRAAFVAAQGGKQVALLVPTTLLAQQHTQTFQDRFADWPVRVESLSRFRSTKETAAVIEGLANGTVDIVIGTHRLLQNKVKFKNLGLVIVDEEHRFGVRHKESLKNLRAEVDILTLTATPIPRTLNMAFGGLRDLSLITTPPSDRLAVKTFVTQWNDGMIREALQREIRRGGQVYFVHNSVQTIEKVREDIERLVPEATVQIGHGQMRERDLEQVMLDFYHRRFNVLLCTTIVESGIDVATANTIIINRADKFGLAQLHQLRGRVGRSHHRAYAYLLTPPPKAMTADAIKRLEAIESLEDLGAGFTLATHDLEIRGAGELLGDEQSGQIQEIGFTLYTELLQRAVAAMKDGRTPDLERPLDHGPQVNLHVPALLPDDYVPDVHMRLILYKRIASAENDEALRELQVELIDRFGLLPDATKWLFDVTALKITAAPLGIAKIDASAGGGRIEFTAQTTVDPMTVIGLVQADPERYSLDGPERLRFRGSFADPAKRLRAVQRLLGKLAAGAGTPTSPAGASRAGRGATR
ncbi:MAG: transcription-repair coupling factor [Pseudomonadota bacterium]